jgi:hypothetical protein
MNLSAAAPLDRFVPCCPLSRHVRAKIEQRQGNAGVISGLPPLMPAAVRDALNARTIQSPEGSPSRWDSAKRLLDRLEPRLPAPT